MADRPRDAHPGIVSPPLVPNSMLEKSDHAGGGVGRPRGARTRSIKDAKALDESFAEAEGVILPNSIFIRSLMK